MKTGPNPHPAKVITAPWLSINSARCHGPLSDRASLPCASHARRRPHCSRGPGLPTSGPQPPLTPLHWTPLGPPFFCSKPLRTQLDTSQKTPASSICSCLSPECPFPAFSQQNLTHQTRSSLNLTQSVPLYARFSECTTGSQVPLCHPILTSHAYSLEYSTQG